MRQPIDLEISSFRENSTLISFLYPARNTELVDKLAARKINAFGKFRILRTEARCIMEVSSYGLHSSYYQSPGFRCFKFNGKYLRLQSSYRSCQSLSKILLGFVVFH